MSVLIVQHHELDPPGRIAETLDAGGVTHETLRPASGDPFGRPQDHDAIVLLGGPMSANDEAEHPWLVEEERFLRRARRRGVPMLGVNLGAHLICKSAGGLIHALRQREFGAGFIALTAEGKKDPLFEGLPEGLSPRFPAVQWTTEGFEVPPGGTVLAESFAGNYQAVRIGENIYGLQFHVELSIEAIEARAEVFGEAMVWQGKKLKVAGTYQFEYSAMARPSAVADVLNEIASVEPHIQPVGQVVFGNFFRKIARLDLKEGVRD